MKKVIGVVVACTMLVGLVGCGPSSKTDNAKKSEQFKVGLLVPGSINDQGWNASANDGLKLIQKELGAETSYVEAGKPTDMKNSYRNYGDKGFNLIFGHGFQYQDSALEVAKDYPNTTFVTIGGNKVAPNLAPVIGKLEEATYLAGIVSAKMSKTQTIGFVGGDNIPAVSKTFRGFELGAKSVNPNIKCIYTYVGSYDDVNTGYEATLSVINKGADIIYANGNAINIGAYKATNEKKVMSWGAISDQSNLSPEYMIGSAMYYTDKIYLAVAKGVKDKKFAANEPINLGLKDQVVELKLNPKFKGKVPEEALALVEKAKKDILDGKIKVPGEFDK